MGPMPGGDWDRWRGSSDERIKDLEEAVIDLWRFKEEADRKLVAMETKIFIFTAIAAALGAFIPSAIAAVFK